MINMLGFLKGKIDVGHVLESAIQGVDKVFYTNEERSDQDIAVADATVAFYEKTLSEKTVRSRTRRFIAIMIIAIYLFIVLLYAFLPFFGVKADHLEPLVFDSPLATGFIATIAFFFGGYYISRFVKSKQKNKTTDEASGKNN